MPVELPELVITSKTQSPQVIRDIMKSQGYEETDFSVDSTSDQPEPEPAPPAAEPPPAAAVPEVPAGQPAGDEDDEEEEEAPPVAVAPAQPPAKPKSGSAKLKEKLSAKEQENATLKAELERLRTLAPPAAAAPVAAPVAPEPAPELRAKPKFEDFAETDDQLSAFNEAMADWKYDERDFKRDQAKREEEQRNAPAREAAATAEAEQRQVNEQWAQRTTAVRQTYPTFEQEIVQAERPSAMLANVIMREEDGPELALWLARNPEQLAHINGLTRTEATSTPAQAAVAVQRAQQHVGRIRYILEREGMPDGTTSREAPPIPAAPAPPAPAIPPPAPVAAIPAAPPLRPKPTPVTPVGSRGATMSKTLAQMTESEVRALHPDVYRQLREAARN